MALTITESTNKTSFNYGDVTYPSFTMSGSSVGIPYWESEGGVFVSKNSNTSVFQPYNKSRTAIIKARRAYATQGNFTPNQTNENGAGVITKVGGTNTAWDAAAVLLGATYQTGNNDSFIEVTITDTTTEKALLFSSIQAADPASSLNDYGWHFLSNGSVIARKSGVPVTLELPYAIGDLFRIERVGSSVLFKINDITIITVSALNNLNLYSYVSFKTLGGTLGKSTFYKTSIEPTVSYTLKINGLFPGQPNYSYEINIDDNTLVSYAEDKSAIYRIKGQPIRSWTLQFNERPYLEYQDAYQFWMYHKKYISFYYVDLVYGMKTLVTFDSGIRTQAISPNSISFSFVVRQVANAPVYPVAFPN